MIYSLIFILVSTQSHAFIDLADSAQSAADIAAIVSASHDLVTEVDTQSEEISDIEKEIKDIRGTMNDTETFGRKTKSILSGPNTSMEDTSSKLRGVTSYIKDLKTYYGKYVGGPISAEAVTAIDNMRKNSDELKTRKREAKASLRATKRELEKQKNRETQRKKDLNYRKKQNDEIKKILGVKDVSGS